MIQVAKIVNDLPIYLYEEIKKEVNSETYVAT
jgi:hypothetical protein